MRSVEIKSDHRAIDVYYKTLDELTVQQGVTHEGGVRRAFGELLKDTARARNWVLVEELSEKAKRRTIRLDGVLRDEWQLPHGHWEAKDSDDDLDVEIRKKRDRNYPFDNIIFEDTTTAILFQDGQEVMRTAVSDREQLARLLTYFYNHTIEPFIKFDDAIAHFQQEIPHIANSLKDKIEQAHGDNRAFKEAFETFIELCRTALNPNIAPAAVDEMLIQHMLTERIIRKVFDVENFTRRNVIAGEVEKVIDSLTSRYFNRSEFLGALDRFYEAIEDAADKLAEFTDKQRFINTVYEKFFQGYSVEIADTHGIVYTPQEIVDFMCAAVEEVLADEFGAKLGDDGVFVIDPATGTGSFVVNLLRRAYASNPRHFERFYREQLFANEVMLMPYYIASLNVEHEYYDLTGHYAPFEGVCFVDTLDLAEGAQQRFAFMTEANTERVERQQQAPITVILGNPPYNVGQVNENDNNKNRKYEIVDKRVAETYSRDSNASSKSKLNDPYVKFFRWATDRLADRNGIVCFVSNNGFIDGIAFDGFRKHMMQDFTTVYHLDLTGNARTRGERRQREAGNVFDDQIRVGIGITIAIRTNERTVKQIHYHRVPDYASSAEKRAILAEHVVLDGTKNSLSTVDWWQLHPDDRHKWLVPEFSHEFDNFSAIGSRETKAASGQDVEAIFKLYSLGVSTNRDAVVYDFDRETLIPRIRQFVEDYNAEVDRYKRSGGKHNVDDFVSYEKIKWSGTLKLNVNRGVYAEFDTGKIKTSIYRPFCKQVLFYDRLLNERPREFATIFPTSHSEEENKIIIAGGYGRTDFAVFLASSLTGMNCRIH